MLIRNIGQRCESPSLGDKARNLLSAVRRESRAGARLADRNEKIVRSKICETCPLWNKTGKTFGSENADIKSAAARASNAFSRPNIVRFPSGSGAYIVFGKTAALLFGGGGRI